MTVSHQQGQASQAAARASLNNVNIYKNQSPNGHGGLYVSGTATLTRSKIYDNTAPDGSQLYLASGSTTNYALPAPPGYWVPAGKCEIRREPCSTICSSPSECSACEAASESCSKDPDAGNCPVPTFSQPCDWASSPEVLGETVYTLPLGAHDADKLGHRTPPLQQEPRLGPVQPLVTSDAP